jgi:hypothetical protein
MIYCDTVIAPATLERPGAWMSLTRRPTVSQRTCAADGCERKYYCRDFCQMHYSRWYRTGSALRPSAIERFHEKYVVDDTSGCWVWQAALQVEGYGIFGVDRTSVLAHRWGYLALVGSIPDDLPLDHVCHNQDRSCFGGPTCRHRRCVNPAHLEPVVPVVNTRRSIESVGHYNARKTHCPQGHEYTPENTLLFGPGYRQCRQCGRDRQKGRKRVRVYDPVKQSEYNRRSYLKRKAAEGNA